jgi:endonuclease/exonuclease/phosphatase family metal-dependent hydrolase
VTRDGQIELREGFRLATWNLERPARRSWKKVPAILEILGSVGADVYVLTESRASLSLGSGYSAIHAPSHPIRRPDLDERWVSVWSRWPARRLTVRPTPWAAAALLDTPAGPVVVYGTVLPYRDEPTANGARASVWTRFAEELEQQAQDWVTIRRLDSKVPLVVAGDFNQSLDGSGWYESAESKAQLRDALRQAGLVCVTTEDVVVSGKLRSHHLIDHVCASAPLVAAGDVSCWEPVGADGKALSDHPGVAVNLACS